MPRSDPANPDAAAPDDTWSVDATGSHAVDRELQRELVRAALFDAAAAPRIGRFAVGERLGAGASSVVYAAYDEHLARRVAIKVFVGASAAHDQVQHEARALARLSHRNVVAVFEAGEWRGRAFIAMELITGTTLARWQATPRPIAALLDAYRQAGLGLAAAHRAGLVHRDFKPANVMVADDGRVVVTDFGLAGAHGEVSDGAGSASAAPLIGTPAYVAPEQRRGAAPHPSADVYSFAVALCEALIGRHPMQPGAASWPRALARRVPRRLYDAISAGMADQPAARGESMTGLLAALTPPSRGRRRAAAIAGLLAAGALVITARSGRSGRGDAPTEALRQHVFTAPSHRALIRQLDGLLAAPPRSDDPAAAAAVRALAVAPLPDELVCRWPAPPVALALADDHAIARDGAGRVHACALDGGAVMTIARDARCAAVGPDGMVGVVDTAAHVHVVRAGAGGWRAVEAAVPPIAIPQTSWAGCPITVVAEPGGRARVLAGTFAIASESAGDIEVAALRGSLEIRHRDGSTLASLDVPAHTLMPQVDISRDGARVLVVTLHGPLQWWQAATGWHEETARFDAPNLIRARLSPSGQRALLVNQFGGLEVRTLGGGSAAWLTSDAITDAVFHGDDTVVASDTENRLWRWDLANQRSGIVAVHRGAVWSVASNAEVLATGSEDGTATVIDRATGATRLAVDLGAEIYRVLLDGDHLVVAGNDGLRRWNWRLGAAAPLADSRGLRIWDVAPATVDGARIYLGGALARGAVFAWTAQGRSELRSSNPSARISAVAVGDAGRLAAAADSHGRLVVIDLAARRIALDVVAHDAWARRVAFDPETATIVTTGDDGALRTWSPSRAEPRITVEISPNRSPVYGLDVHRGRAVTASYDGGVALVDLATGRILQRYRGHTSALRIVRFRGDGRWFVTGDSDGRVCLWRVDAPDCHTWLDGHRSSVLAAEFADDGTIVTASSDGIVRSWRPSYDQPIAALLGELARHRSWWNFSQGDLAEP